MKPKTFKDPVCTLPHLKKKHFWNHFSRNCHNLETFHLQLWVKFRHHPYRELCLPQTYWNTLSCCFRQEEGWKPTFTSLIKTMTKLNSPNSRTWTELRATKPHSILTRQPIMHRSHQISWDKSSKAAANIELSQIRHSVCFWLHWRQTFSNHFHSAYLVLSAFSCHSSHFALPPFKPSACVCMCVWESVNYLPVQYPDLIDRVNFFPSLPLPASSAAAFSCRMRQTATMLWATVQIGVIQTNDFCESDGCLAGPSSLGHIRSVVDQMSRTIVDRNPRFQLLDSDKRVAGKHEIHPKKINWCDIITSLLKLADVFWTELVSVVVHEPI